MDGFLLILAFFDVMAEATTNGGGAATGMAWPMVAHYCTVVRVESVKRHGLIFKKLWEYKAGFMVQ
jgi:hypothetical protein